MKNFKWYKVAKEVNALRKHTLRVDLHTHCGEPEEFNSENEMLSTLKGIISAAIVKGLDIIGIVSHAGPFLGQKAVQLVQQDGVDLYVLSGEEYYTPDKVRFIAYNLKDKMPPNMPCEQAIKYVHDNHGFVMVIDVSKRMLQHLNKLEGTSSAPDAIEIYNASTGGYRDVNTDYPRFISSASKSPHDMDTINVYTLIDRKDVEGMGLLPQHYGENYTPQYLQRKQQEESLPPSQSQPQQQANPQLS